MWKWTTQPEIVLIDTDSIEINETNSLMMELSSSFKVVTFGKSESKSFDNYVKMIHFYDLICEVLKKEKKSSDKVVVLTRNNLVIRDALKYRIGTILVRPFKWDNGYLPDYICWNMKRILSILRDDINGYVGEMWSGSIKGRSILHVEKIDALRVKNKEMYLYAGGRYYPKSKDYIDSLDPFSKEILDFKSGKVDFANRFYGEAIKKIHKKDPIDQVTFIPMKKRDLENGRINRFKKLNLKTQNFKVDWVELLKCDKDYSQKYSTSIERQENVKGAFQVREN
ncbi:hypothetical protein [uncultured Dubosiella sp.]|uniref:hypothetical protein n=1 Tax=uncultured Dubosiella sp. TaxID=1937011 RepID=UPI0025A5196E|nr:hypothetical protein [uncultured Dubosiella sp.]